MGEQSQALDPMGGANPPSPSVNTLVQLDRTPFANLKVRHIVGGLAVGFGCTYLTTLLFLPRGTIRDDTLMQALFTLLFYCFYSLFVAAMVRQSRLDSRSLTGPLPSWSLLWRNALIGVPLQITSAVSIFFSAFVVSYFLPDYVKSLFLDRKQDLAWIAGGGDFLTILLSFFSVVIMAPIVEELIFRGILLTRWTFRWNLQRAILVSSAIFAVLHPPYIVGAFVFGYVFSLVYVRTRSLFASIAIHATNNFLVWTIVAVSSYGNFSTETATIEEFQSYWWIAAILAIAVTPWLIKLARQHHAILSQGIPYLATESAYGPLNVERTVP